MHFFRGLALVFLVLISVIGCSSTYYQYHSVSPYDHPSDAVVMPIYIDKDFTVDEVVAIDQAVEEWNRVLNGQIKLDIKEKPLDLTTDEGKKIAHKLQLSADGIMFISINEDLADANAIDPGVLAYAAIDEHYIGVLVDTVGHRNLRKILLHELGHMLGANHVHNRSLMYPVANALQSDCVDEETAKQVATMMHLEFSKMTWCDVPDPR